MKLGVMHGDILRPQPLGAVLTMARRSEAAGLESGTWFVSGLGDAPRRHR
jgi:hypothetical protein